MRAQYRSPLERGDSPTASYGASGRSRQRCTAHDRERKAPGFFCFGEGGIKIEDMIAGTEGRITGRRENNAGGDGTWSKGSL
eukprot:9224510-Pyramimonas_sp.AAC.1